ncbi:hypothetical protein [Serratia marcescens]|uniref:hypothetical protein n=1 Tax=Serratia TaxID=613 RepID=UPI0018D87C31|nr:hypothetical protein [Serratia marcescens]
MSRNHKYDISIRISSKTNDQIGIFDVEYPHTNNSRLKDKIVIKEKLIKITAYRSKKTSITDVIHNVNTAMNHQISKSLAFYYASVGMPNKITSIKITRHLSGKIQESQTIIKSNVRQIVTSDNGFDYLKKINKVELATIFEENSKGRSLLYAVTHLISSCSSPEPFQQFEALWKCFNSIYKLKENFTQDFECLKKLRAHMLAASSKYPLSTDYVSSMTHDNIFSIVNWRNMILNDFRTEAQSKSLCGFITRISDARLIKKIEDSLSIRQNFLDNEGVLKTVRTHIEQKKNTNVNSDIEVVAFMCLKYLYYVRNKLIHAERVHPSFHWVKEHSNEEMKISKCNVILKLLIIDLLNFNTAF